MIVSGRDFDDAAVLASPLCFNVGPGSLDDIVLGLPVLLGVASTVASTGAAVERVGDANARIVCARLPLHSSLVNGWPQSNPRLRREHHLHCRLLNPMLFEEAQ